MPDAIFAILAGLFGLLIGSFLNVCIHRWPLELSVVRPRSACPQCQRQIAWYDNIPLLSFVLLRGKCRGCSAAISWRYPTVELITGAAFFWFVLRLGPGLLAAKYCVFSAILIGLIFSDLETLLLPDEFTWGGLAIGLGFSIFTGSIPESAIGAAVPAGCIWLLGWLFEKLRQKQGLGFGDVKMIAMIGAFLGLASTLLTIVLASILGSVVGLIYIKAAAKDASSYQLPFGTFLGIAALFTAVAGEAMLRWYTSLLA